MQERVLQQFGVVVPLKRQPWAVGRAFTSDDTQLFRVRGRLEDVTYAQGNNLRDKHKLVTGLGAA